ncbi:hypothetical protein M422DRAFT_33444 [Sphaerobolus stellatus SS14]|uniref:Uncharacterized protein n=1 Tax=Sphaerobolus stellatus (strain SS14) TaxID=990650 RepID=A0A0C9U544_SPHS4|nr:hypothetical protein M422DRAFT_33444 [Sphaerobolus stellatus SS14]
MESNLSFVSTSPKPPSSFPNLTNHSHEELIIIRARQLEKRQEDPDLIKERVTKARYTSIAQFEKENASLIIDYDFAPGSLGLVRNFRIETSD